MTTLRTTHESVPAPHLESGIFEKARAYDRSGLTAGGNVHAGACSPMHDVFFENQRGKVSRFFGDLKGKTV